MATRKPAKAPPKVNPGLGEFIKSRRIALKLSQLDLANRLNAINPQFEYADSSVSHWENGNVAPPLGNRDFVAALSKVLETTPFWLFQAAGWLDGSESPLTPQYMVFLHLLDRLTEDQRQIIFNVLKATVAQQGRENSH